MSTSALHAPRRHATRRRARRRIVVRWVAVILATALSAVAGYGVAYAVDRLGETTPRGMYFALPERPVCTPEPLPRVLISGSSTMQEWASSAGDLAPMNTVNIGVGATTMRDQLLYLEPIVTKFDPDAIVMFAGANDLAVAGNGNADRVIEMVKEYVATTEKLLPDTVIYFVSINTAPSRAGNAPGIDKVNAAIAQAATTDGTLRYIETNAALLGADGKPDSTKFQSDALHLNESGYAIFGKIIEERLVADGFAESDCVFPDGTIDPDPAQVTSE